MVDDGGVSGVEHAEIVDNGGGRGVEHTEMVNDGGGRGVEHAEMVNDGGGRGVEDAEMCNDGGGKSVEELPAMVSVPAAKKKLLVLDVNGLLVATYHRQEALPPEPHHAKLGNFYVYKRPFCDEFVLFCLENFTVGIWSSAREFNVNNLVEFVFKDLRHQLAFSWHQTHCTLTGVKHPDKQHKPVFLKELSQLWATFKPGEYGPSNCLLVDDSPYKALKNPPSTGIFPRTYTGHESDDNFLGGALWKYLEGLRDAEDVQVYVEKNPIGEPSITAASPLWQVYSGVIGVDQPESVNREANAASNSTLAGHVIITHETSKNSSLSSPVCQLEESYPNEKWSDRPRPVAEGILGKRPKHGWKREDDSHSGEWWGHSRRTVYDEKWGKHPINEWDRIIDSHSGEQWSHSPRTVDDGKWGKQPKSSWEGEVDSYSGEQWGHSPRTVDDERWGEQSKSMRDRETESVGWDHFNKQYDVALPPQGGSQVDREGSELRWDRDYQHGESNHWKRSEKAGGWKHMEGGRESDASFVPPLPGRESPVDRGGSHGRWDRWDRVHQHDGKFDLWKTPVEAGRRYQMDNGRDWDAPRGRTNWHGRGRSWGQNLEHGSGHWNRHSSPPYKNGRDSSLVEWRRERDVTDERRYEHYRGQYEQNASVTHAPSQRHSNRGRESLRIPANKDHVDEGGIWGWGHPSVEDQDQEQDRWADFRVENRAGAGSWGVASSADEIQNGWANFAVENKRGGGSWGACSTEEQVQVQDSSKFTMESRGDEANWEAPTIENQVDGWENLATDGFGPNHGWANESEEDPIRYKTNHYRYDSRPGFGGRNHYWHESRASFATQNQGGHRWEGEYTDNARPHSRHLSSENQRRGDGWEAHSGNDSSCASWPSPSWWNSTPESREPGRTSVPHGHH